MVFLFRSFHYQIDNLISKPLFLIKEILVEFETTIGYPNRLIETHYNY